LSSATGLCLSGCSRRERTRTRTPFRFERETILVTSVLRRIWVLDGGGGVGRVSENRLDRGLKPGMVGDSAPLHLDPA
jgi:hypothetical protein